MSVRLGVQGAKPITLTVLGAGKELKCLCAPPSVELPPVMPHAEASATTFELKNPTDYPIEVYSVEFDEAYDEEEAMVREDVAMPTASARDDAVGVLAREQGPIARRQIALVVRWSFEELWRFADASMVNIAFIYWFPAKVGHLAYKLLRRKNDQWGCFV